MNLVLEPLDKSRHDRSGFTCGSKPLDDYLHRQAAKYQAQGVSITYVLADSTAPARILGFFTLAAGQVERAPPKPIPVIRLARLGVAHSEQGKQYGTLLLSLAVEKTAAAADYAGVYALVVDAKDAHASRFYQYLYQHHGFYELQSDGMTLFLPLAETGN